jgi:hypothetical protein
LLAAAPPAVWRNHWNVALTKMLINPNAKTAHSAPNFYYHFLLIAIGAYHETHSAHNFDKFDRAK